MSDLSAAPAGLLPAASGWSPAVRLLVDRGRTVGWRPGAVVAALVARGLRLRAYAVWPSTRHPRIAADLGHPAAAAWLRTTFEADRRRPYPVGAATWSAIRARGLIVGPPSRLTVEAVRRAVDRDVGQVRLALYSPTGQSNTKAACFVFEGDAPEPGLVIKAMPEVRYAERLRHETEIVESFRSRLGSSSPAAAALPLPPLFAGAAAGDYVVVQPVDPLAGSTGRIDDPATALAWLRSFQQDTVITTRAWDDADTARALDSVRYAWCRERPTTSAAAISKTEGLLRTLEGYPVRRCAVHGDFWRGNISQRDGRLRVYDWEWAEEQGTPFFDLWTSELGVLRTNTPQGEPELVQALREAVRRVSAELDAQGFNPSFALATLAPSLAHLAFRVRRTTGFPGGAESESVRLMTAVEALLS